MEELKKVVSKLNELIEKGFSKTELENDLGLPKNNLSGYLSGFKKIPSKYFEKILGYNTMTRKELLAVNELLTKENDSLKEFIKNINPVLSPLEAQKSPVIFKAQQQAKVVDLGNSATNNDNAVDIEEIKNKIELLRKSADSCADTRMGKLAKANYMNQVWKLEALLK